MIARNALLYLARQEGLKDFATRFSPFKRMTTRFVAGEDIEEATAAIRSLNDHGCEATFDHLNESVGSRDETKSEVQEYLKVLERIDKTGIRSNVSIKLTQFGLDIDGELTYQNARQVVMEAARRGNFVRIDMEGSAVTQTTIDIAKRLRAEFGVNDVGIVLQSYLRRTEQDLRELLKLPMRIRLCKGAYKEGPDVAFSDKSDVDRNFIKLSKILLSSGVYHGLATHDPKMIDACVDFVQKEKIERDAFEFQLLYGIRRDLQEQLARDGYHVRVYVPYGRHWYPYFMRRLAERPANVWFLLKNMFKG
ncbi:MAG: proline dehydrogenase family protein [Pyrinomonadaceae bacterium]